MSDIFITSDIHFGHNKDFIYKARGYNSIEEHDEDIIERWNSIINSEDTVFILGDLVLYDTEVGIQKINQLNGYKEIIIGNHDNDSRVKTYKNEIHFGEVLGFAYQIDYRKFHFYLSHYPTLCGNGFNEPKWNKVVNLCGHTHTQNPWHDWCRDTIYHCELDAHHNYPIALDKIISDIKNYK